MESKSYLKKIITFDNDTKKEEMMELICDMIEDLDHDEHEEVERRLYEILEGRVLTEDKARHLIEAMKPYGKKWELADTEGVRTQYGYEDIRPVDFWIVMNSAFNDYNDIFKDNVEMYAKFSRDFIKDEDAVDEKVYYYFTMLPKGR